MKLKLLVVHSGQFITENSIFTNFMLFDSAYSVLPFFHLPSHLFLIWTLYINYLGSLCILRCVAQLCCYVNI